jgi:hypothetical protein
MTSCPAAETFLKPPSASLDWWDREVQRKQLLAEAENLHSERALWTALT